MFLKNSITHFLILIFVLSCQPIEIIKPIQIDNARLAKISIYASEIKINNKYDPIFSEKNIEDQILISPINVIQNWMTENIINNGNYNKLIVNIIDASITKEEIENLNAKNFEEKTVFHYTVSYLVEYELYDNSNYLLANSTVETLRSTTSKKLISLNETEVIINNLLNDSIRDFSIETKSILKKYMGEYLN